MVNLKDIFEIGYGTKLDFNETIPVESGGVLYITRSAVNHGIKTRVELIPGIEPNPAGTITVPLGGEGRLTANLQFAPYYNGQNIAILKPKKTLSINELLYYVLIIRKNQFKYTAFGREANVTLPTIKVPSVDEISDFVKNSNYELVLENVNEDNKFLKNQIKYKKFKLTDLFDIVENNSNQILISEAESLPDGNIGVVSSSEKNNGISKFVDMDQVIGYKIFEEGCMTLAKNGTVGTAFYHDTKIVTTTDVIVLKYKYGKLNKELGLYYKILIEKNQFKFNYGRKISGDRINEIILNVPVDSHGNPNREIMEKTVRLNKYYKYI